MVAKLPISSTPQNIHVSLLFGGKVLMDEKSKIDSTFFERPIFNYYCFLGTVATLGSFFLTSRHQRRHQRLPTTASGHQQRQRQGQFCRASGRTAQRERAAEVATRAVGARRESRRHCRRRVDNVTRASDEQRMAGGCSNDGGGDVVARTAGGG